MDSSESSGSAGGPTPPHPNPFLRLAWRVVGFLALAGIVFLVVGLALPGTWEVQRTRTLPGPIDVAYASLADLDRWDDWMPWQGVETQGSATRRTWSDPSVGDGTLEIVATRSPVRIDYVVEVEGGLRTQGTFELEPLGAGTEVLWIERGDFGRNPLLAYFALAMERLQGREMDKALDRLEAVLRDPSSRRDTT